MNSPQKSGSILDILFWPLLLGFAFLSVILAMQWFFSADIEGSFLRILDFPKLGLAGIFQVLALLSVIFAWLFNLRLHGLSGISFMQAATMVGINSIGKYTPGKVWGVVARGGMLMKIARDRNMVIRATLVEQLAMIHSGLMIALVAYCWKEEIRELALLCLVLALLSVAAVARGGFYFSRMKSLIRKEPFDPLLASDQAFKQSYIAVFAVLSLVWLLSAAVLYFCIAVYLDQPSAGAWEILLITAMAYLSGFLAFFSLAGLGVREGVMVAMLSLHMDVTVALYISILHRFITLVFDVLLGCFALLSSRSVLDNKNFSV